MTGDDLQDRREVAEAGRAYGLALAEYAIETFVTDMTDELAEAAASAMRSDIIERGGEMMDKGTSPALAIAWGEACAKALQDRLTQEGPRFRRLAALLAPPAEATKQ